MENNTTYIMLNTALACEGHGVKGDFVYLENGVVGFKKKTNGDITLIDSGDISDFGLSESKTTSLSCDKIIRYEESSL